MTDQRTAALTGAAGGLGGSIAEALRRAGYRLLLIDRSDHVVDVAKRMAADGGDAIGVVADLTTPGGVAAVFDAVADSGSRLDVLVNNAGTTRDARLVNMTPEAFDTVIQVNLLAAMNLTFGLEELFSYGSSIVNISSRAALGNFGQANYVTSKSALIGFTRALAQSWSPRVRANAVAPGLINTPMTQAMPADVLTKLVDATPAARIGTPDDVAAAVVFLASENAAYVNGQVLTVCGGRSIAP